MTADTHHVHLVSDSTGETLNTVVRACLVQFDTAGVVEHMWSMVRTPRQLEKVIAGIQANPGLVLYTLVDDSLREGLQLACRAQGAPAIAVLDPVLAALGRYFGAQAMHRPGRQHQMDAEYFARIEAMNFAMAHDDGQHAGDLESADVVLVGVSRTSKTPTCIYLANRGIKAANIPLVPGVSPPQDLDRLRKPLVVALTNDPASLVQVRKNRLRMLREERETDYVDLDAVRAEVAAARKYFVERGWPVLDTTRRSIEETAAAIIQLLADRDARRDGGARAGAAP